MLWYRSWIETRWRFLIGMAVLVCSAVMVVATWHRVQELLPSAGAIQAGGEFGRLIREAVEVQSTYRGYVWSQVFAHNLTNMATLFAVVLGAGGMLSTSSRASLFLLSLPVSRERVTAVRAAMGLAELLAMTLLPAVALPWLSVAVGESYPLSAAVVHGLCLFAAAAVFYSFASLLSCVFHDFWKPLVVSLIAALALGYAETMTRGLGGFGLFRVMSGETWFRSGQVPWLGLAGCLAVSAVLLWQGAAITRRRDF